MNLIFGNTYKLIWLQKQPSNSQVGEVRNYTKDRSGYRVIPIACNNALLSRINMRFIVSGSEDNRLAIIVNEAFLSLPKVWREAGVWHEVGHVHYEHFNTVVNQEELRAIRVQHAQNNKVMPQELEADQFAVERVGKAAVSEFLNFLLQTRLNGSFDGLNQLGCKELELRIKQIRNLPSRSLRNSN